MAINNNVAHLPKDLLVFALNNMCDDSALQVILAWPSCQKDDVHGTIKLFGDKSELYYKTTGNKVMNFSSDGDGTRKIAFHELTSFNINISTPLGAMISKMDFLDSNCGKYQETVSFDPKHLVKRCWTNMINESCIINDIPLMKKDLADLIALSESDLGFQVISLLYPKDKQNVPSATAFLLRFIDAVRSLKKLPYRLIGIKGSLVSLSYVLEGLLVFYAFPEMGICEQIESFAEASFILMILKRLNANVIPNQLFHDLQATFQDAIFYCSKMKLLCPSLPLYLVRNGTDPVERYFGNVRIVNHNNSIDYLEFLNSSSAVKGIDFMINDKHVTWGRGKGKVSRRLCLDF